MGISGTVPFEDPDDGIPTSTLPEAVIAPSNIGPAPPPYSTVQTTGYEAPAQNLSSSGYTAGGGGGFTTPTQPVQEKKVFFIKKSDLSECLAFRLFPYFDKNGYSMSLIFSGLTDNYSF